MPWKMYKESEWCECEYAAPACKTTGNADCERKSRKRKAIESSIEAANASNKCVIEIKMWFLLWRHESFQSQLTQCSHFLPLSGANSTEHTGGERNHTRGCTCISASLVSFVSYALTWQLSVERSQYRVIRGDYSSSAHFSVSRVRRAFLIGDVASVPAAAAVTTNSAMAMANEISLFVSWALPASGARIVYCLSTTYRLLFIIWLSLRVWRWC